MPSGVVPHYQQCLLMWFLAIDHACHYRPCLLANCHCDQHFTSQMQMEEGWLQVWCYSFRCDITSDMSADPVPLYDMHACTVQLYQTCMLGSFIDTRVCIVLLYQARHLVCHKSIRHVYRQGAALAGLKKTCWLPSWMPS